MDHLIPESLFVNLPLIALLAIGAAALWVLSQGADWLVEGASELAVHLGIPKVVVGATIVSLGTTTPECAVSVMAAWAGNSGLALGNAIGSVIFDAAVIFGGGCLLTTLPADKFLLRRQGWVQVGTAVLLAVFCYSQFVMHGDAAMVPRWAGAVLLGLLAIYLVVSVRWSRQHTALARPGGPAGETSEDPEHQHSNWRLLFSMFLGLVFVLLGSRVTIICVTIIARRLQIPDVVISATLVAFGTSLPEVIVGIAAIRKRHPELLVGNVIGADILNILFVTGAAAVAKDLPIVDPHSSDPYVFLWLHLPTMLIVLAYFRVCIAASVNRGTFRRWMGLPMVLAYLIFVGLSLVGGHAPH